MATKTLPRKKSLKSDEGLQVYCRKCMKVKPSKEFYTSVDSIDSNGFMSVCKTCCNTLYENNFLIENNFEKALLRTCKSLNIAWIPSAVDATETHVEKFKSQGKTDIQVFGIYKSKVMTLGNASNDTALTFEEYPTQESININTPEEDASETYQELQEFWGKRSFDDIKFMQKEFNALGGAEAFKDDRPKAILLREICFQMLDIEKSRDQAGVDKKVKALAELMGNSAIRPDQKKVADGNRSSEAFGVWLADIEKYKPAEWYKDQNIYKDVNNIKEYWDTHILRPFLNFWGVQKNMNFPGSVERDDSFNDAPTDISEE